MNGEPIDLAIIGAGPAGLSLGALLRGKPDQKRLGARFQIFDRKQSFSWHADQDFAHSKMLSSVLRDLVTPVEPTNEFSFLQFLHQNGRLAAFMNRGVMLPSRSEFAEYLSWCAGQLKEVSWSSEVSSLSITSDGNFWRIGIKDCLTEETSSTLARHAVLCTGWTPNTSDIEYPDCQQVFHSSKFWTRYSGIPQGSRVAVIGAGQTAAEIILHLLGDKRRIAEVLWFDSNPSPRLLNLNHFVKEYFTHEYGQTFWGRSSEARAKVLAKDRSVSHGISGAMFAAIYERLYRNTYHDGGPRLRTRFLTQVTRIAQENNALTIASQSSDANKCDIVDAVVIATGFRNEHTLLDQVAISGRHRLNFDCSVSTGKDHKAKLFVLNANFDEFGLGDGALSTIPGRAAAVLNAMDLGFRIEATPQELLVDW